MFILSSVPTVANKLIAELRDSQVQKDSMRFRHNLKRLGFMLAYEISKDFDYTPQEIETPLATTTLVLPENVVLISVLRAAMPFYNGFLEVFDHAESGFVGAYRVESKNVDDVVEVDYLYQACPNLEGKTVIIIDPMLATGKSFVKTYQNLLKNGTPKTVHLAAVIAAPEGVSYIKEQLVGYSVKIWTCALDSHLNEHSYIVPGLGDAGDLSFGEKM